MAGVSGFLPSIEEHGEYKEGSESLNIITEVDEAFHLPDEFESDITHTVGKKSVKTTRTPKKYSVGAFDKEEMNMTYLDQSFKISQDIIDKSKIKTKKMSDNKMHFRITEKDLYEFNAYIKSRLGKDPRLMQYFNSPREYEDYMMEYQQSHLDITNDPAIIGNEKNFSEIGAVVLKNPDGTHEVISIQGPEDEDRIKDYKDREGCKVVKRCKSTSEADDYIDSHNLTRAYSSPSEKGAVVLKNPDGTHEVISIQGPEDEDRIKDYKDREGCRVVKRCKSTSEADNYIDSHNLTRAYSTPTEKVVIVETTSPDKLVEIIQAIKDHGNPGHSFDIIMDEDSKEEFNWDGDGSDSIGEIKIEDNKLYSTSDVKTKDGLTPKQVIAANKSQCDELVKEFYKRYKVHNEGVSIKELDECYEECRRDFIRINSKDKKWEDLLLELAARMVAIEMVDKNATRSHSRTFSNGADSLVSIDYFNQIRDALKSIYNISKSSSEFKNKLTNSDCTKILKSIADKINYDYNDKTFSDKGKDWWVVAMAEYENGDKEVRSAYQPQDHKPTKEEMQEFEGKGIELHLFKAFDDERSADVYAAELRGRLQKEQELSRSYSESEKVKSFGAGDKKIYVVFYSTGDDLSTPFTRTYNSIESAAKGVKDVLNSKSGGSTTRNGKSYRISLEYSAFYNKSDRDRWIKMSNLEQSISEKQRKLDPESDEYQKLDDKLNNEVSYPKPFSGDAWNDVETAMKSIKTESNLKNFSSSVQKYFSGGDYSDSIGKIKDNKFSTQKEFAVIANIPDDVLKSLQGVAKLDYDDVMAISDDKWDKFEGKLNNRYERGYCNIVLSLIGLGNVSLSELTHRIESQVLDIYRTSGTELTYLGEAADKVIEFVKSKGSKTSVYSNNACPESGCIQKKPNGSWGIISNKTGEFWEQDYESEDKAKDALAAYHASKHFNDTDSNPVRIFSYGFNPNTEEVEGGALDTMDNLIGSVIYSVSYTHLFHLTTQDYPAHIALNEYYEDMPDLVDALAEGWLSQQKDIYLQNAVLPADCPIDYLGRLKDYITTLQNEHQYGSAVNSQIDAIVELIDSTLYKLKRLSNHQALFTEFDTEGCELTINDGGRKRTAREGEEPVEFIQRMKDEKLESLKNQEVDAYDATFSRLSKFSDATKKYLNKK